MKTFAIIILASHISQSAAFARKTRRTPPVKRDFSPAPPNIYELLNKQEYKKLITNYCPQMRDFFTPERITKYCRNSFDDLLGPDSGSVSIDCNQQGYVLTRRSMYEEAGAREISVMVILKEQNLKDRLILAEDCVYQGGIVLLIHPRVVSLEGMMDKFKLQASDFLKKISFMISVANIYEALAQQGVIHGTPLLDSIVVDPTDISRVWLRSFDRCFFLNEQRPPAIASNYGLGYDSRGTGDEQIVLIEKQQLVRLLIVIQDSINGDPWEHIYDRYMGYNPSEPRLQYQSEKRKKAAFINWCEETMIRRQNYDGALEYTLCTYFEDPRTLAGPNVLTNQLQKMRPPKK